MKNAKKNKKCNNLKKLIHFLGGTETERSACAMGKRGPPFANGSTFHQSYSTQANKNTMKKMFEYFFL